LGQNVIVENRTGAAGQIAMGALKASPADGSVLVMTPLVTVVTAPHIQQLPYDPFKDFAPVAHTANFLFAFSMGPATPAKSLKEYIGLVKQDAKYANYASAATGSLPHFFSLLFAEKAGLKMNHIGYRGTAAAMTDLLGGQIAAFMGTVSDVAPQHKAGKIVAVATSGATRSKHLPDIPTFKELGYEIEGGGWYAAYAPAGTPAPVIDRLSKAIIAALNEPDVVQRLDNYGMEPTGLPPAELARIHRRDYEQWGPVIKASGFKPGS
ncbi:MAG: tripartite tricarboxylate transporter substrate-binding protein, partial [Betaproteobacteria bacterium]|nr:tripartite tricarboxylate transporter substrate-binding protein [Betaproteobacteria bacterium]